MSKTIKAPQRIDKTSQIRYISGDPTSLNLDAADTH
jgi:hypothetical protein